jgi:hypothetical protein
MVSFSTQIAPLIRMRCGGCHNPYNTANNNTLHNRMTGMVCGKPFVTVGMGAMSLLIRKLEGATADCPDGGRMPRSCMPNSATNPCFTTAQTDLIIRWINEGALNN